MSGQPGFFDAEERLRALSAAGDPLERLAAAVEFELFRPELEAALRRSDRAKGGRPPYDPVLMFRVLVLQTLYTLSDEQTEYQLKDRLSLLRFAGLAPHDPVPDAKTTIWLFREQLVRAGAVEKLLARFDAALRERGLLAMGGQIIDATVVRARPARPGSRPRRRRRSVAARSRQAGHRRAGRRSTATRAGRSGAAASGRPPRVADRSGRRRRSRCRCSATRAISGSTGRTA